MIKSGPGEVYCVFSVVSGWDVAALTLFCHAINER